jgi:AraC-like DNA-binding protein
MREIGGLMEDETAPGPAAPTAHVSLARLVLAGLSEEDSDRWTLARGVGLPELVIGGNSARVPMEYLARLWRLGIGRTGDPLLGVRVASQWRLGRLHLADYLFQTSATLAEAVTTQTRYAALLNTADNEIRLTSDEDGAGTVTYQIRSGDPEVDPLVSQFALGVVLSRARHAASRDVRPLSLALASAAPSRYRELAAWFGAHRIEFGAERSAITLAPADLSLPLPGADAPLAAVLREHAAGVIAAQTTAPAVTDRLRQVVAEQLASGGPSLSAAARRLALSPRSLQRRLAEDGTTWRDLVDEVRRDRAAVLLAGGLSRTAAAARLGFSDARALRAAQRRWRSGADCALLPAGPAAVRLPGPPGRRLRPARTVGAGPG